MKRLLGLALQAASLLRPNSELFTLEWTNVHLDTSAEGPHGHIHVPGGKTDAARRNVPLTPRAKALLAARRAAKVISFYVFPGPGKSGHAVTIQHSHERAIHRANKTALAERLQKPAIEPFEFYCWRHTCGTRWAEAGMDKYTVARLMGHSSRRVAERYYIHVTELHVTSGFERFPGCLERRLVESVRAVT
jgi:integrase